MKLDVHVTLSAGEQVLAGQLDCGEILSGGRYGTRFSYAHAWLKHKSFFPLDPESLDPLKAGKTEFESQGLAAPLLVFMDSLPDDWGRQLLITQRRLIGVQQESPYLLKEMGSAALGALAFAESGKPCSPLATHDASVTELADLLDAAERFERGDRSMSPATQRLLEAGSSPGGARPKSLVREDGTLWIAKFPSKNRDYEFDVVGLEAACLQVAENAGLEVPASRISPAPGKKALLVKRFDIHESGGRCHMISLRTLCKEAPGAFVLTYKEVMEKIRKHSCRAAEDVEAFFRQMVFNAVIGNTDDHLKNFLMIHDGRGYRLSKTFDVIPDIAARRDHQLFFRLHPQTSGQELVEVGAQWQVRDPVAIIRQVCEASLAFAVVARGLGVEENSVNRFGREIRERAVGFLQQLPAR
jgi:serine/threonine-protein kinase HipA